MMQSFLSYWYKRIEHTFSHQSGVLQEYASAFVLSCIFYHLSTNLQHFPHNAPAYMKVQFNTGNVTYVIETKFMYYDKIECYLNA